MISKGDVQGLAELARLKIGDEEVEALQKDISDILEYVGQVNSASVEADAGYSPLKNVMRADAERGAGDPLAGTRESLLEALPRREGDYAVVRKILQKDE